MRGLGPCRISAVCHPGPGGRRACAGGHSAGAGQQRPESASDPDVDAAQLAERAGTGAFSTTRLRPGYDVDQVDAFLSAIRDTFLGIREPSLTPDEIRANVSVTRFRPGYAVEEVDAFLDEAESRLAAQVRAMGEAPAASQPSLAADMQAGALRVRCLQCGSESAEAARDCARCGGPVTRQKVKMGARTATRSFTPAGSAATSGSGSRTRSRRSRNTGKGACATSSSSSLPSSA